MRTREDDEDERAVLLLAGLPCAILLDAGAAHVKLQRLQSSLSQLIDSSLDARTSLHKPTQSNDQSQHNGIHPNARSRLLRCAVQLLRRFPRFAPKCCPPTTAIILKSDHPYLSPLIPPSSTLSSARHRPFQMPRPALPFPRLAAPSFIPHLPYHSSLLSLLQPYPTLSYPSLQAPDHLPN